MFTRLSYIGAVVLFLLAAALRLSDLGTLPPGLNADEIANIRITETIRQGRVEVFYDLGGEGRESLYPLVLASVTTVFGGGLIGYRIFSVFVGLITLALVYALGTRLYGTLAGLLAMALLSVTLFPTLLARSITPEALLPLLITAALLALARSLPVYSGRGIERPQTTSFAALGIILGLGFYLHPINFALTLLSVLYIAYMVLLHRPLSRRTVSYTWFALVLLIVVATPYLISSLQRPDLAGAVRLFPTAMTTAWERFISGIVGIFIRGDRSPLYNLPELPLIDLISALLLLIGVITALRYRGRTRFALLLLAVLFIAPFALLAADSPNFLAFAPILPLIALLVGIGGQTLITSVPQRARWLIGLGLVALIGYHAVATTLTLFNVWQHQPAVQTAYNARIGQIAAHLDRTAATLDTVVCTTDLMPPPDRRRLASVQILNLMLHRRNLPIRYADCDLALVLPNGGERAQIIRLESANDAEINPYLAQWFARMQMVNAVNLPADTLFTLDVNELLADRVGAFTTTAPITFAREAPGGAQVALPPLRFENNLAFLGYENTWAETYQPGAVVPLTLYWRVDGALPPDLRLFTHVLSDPASCCVAQLDTISVLPASLRPRDVFVQVVYIQLPTTIRAGEYSISIGAYQDNNDMRLTIFSEDAPRGTRLFLGGFTVEG